MDGAKLPPRDQDAEEAVIGSLLIDGAAIYKIDTFLQPPDFYYEQNQWLYAACLALHQRNDAVNQITIAQELARQGKLEPCGGAAHLSHLISICPTSLDVEHYGQIVYRLSVMRQLISAGDHIAGIGYEADPDVNASLGKAEEILFKLRHGQGPKDLLHIRTVLDKYFEATSPPADGQTPGALPYVKCDFTGLDEFLGGFQRSDLVVVAGRPSMGKTSLALSIARNAAIEHKACVALFSLEMSRDAVVLRLLSNESGVNLRKVRLGQHNDDEERRIMDAIGVLSEAPIYMDDSPMLRVGEMRSKVHRLYHERGIDMIIVDHLGLMQGEGRTDNRVQEVSYISRSLKAVAREFNVPLLAVSQLSRASERRESHVPQLADLRDSGSIEQDADVVLFIYREEYYYKEDEWNLLHAGEPYPRGEADLIIAKHRNGPIGQVKLRFTHELARFDNIASEEAKLM